MSVPKVDSIVVNYDDVSDVTAVRVVFEGGKSVKGASFCAPDDEPLVRLGIFEALIDALRGAPVDCFVDTMRVAVATNVFAQYGDWEDESVIEREVIEGEKRRVARAFEFGKVVGRCQQALDSAVKEIPAQASLSGQSYRTATPLPGPMPPEPGDCCGGCS